MVAVPMHPPYVEVAHAQAQPNHSVTQDEIEHMEKIREMVTAKLAADAALSSYQDKLGELMIERTKAAFALSDYLVARPDVAKDVLLRCEVRAAGTDLDKLEAIRDRLPPPKDLV